MAIVRPRLELRNARIKLRLTQNAVAIKVGIDRTIYNKIERGKIKNVPVELAADIAKAVKSSVNKIFLNCDAYDVHKKSKAV